MAERVYLGLTMCSCSIVIGSGYPTNSPTKRAPDAGDSAHISGIFLRLIIFLAGRLRRPCPAQVTHTVGLPRAKFI